MKIPLKDFNGQDQGEIEVNFPLVENGRGTQAVHDVVVAYRANQRMGTACTKTMGEVHGSGKKPWRQKGTGMARAGSFQSPLWRGGGVVFGPKPRDFSKKVTKKTRLLALRKAMSERLKAGDVIIVDDVKLDSPKTKGVLDFLRRLNLDGTVVIVVSKITDNLSLGARNLPGLEIATGPLLNTYQVLRSDKLVFTRSAFEQLQERLKD